MTSNVKINKFIQVLNIYIISLIFNILDKLIYIIYNKFNSTQKIIQICFNNNHITKKIIKIYLFHI